MSRFLSLPLGQTIDDALSETMTDVIDRLQLDRTFAETSWVGWLILLGWIFGGLVVGKIVESILRGVSRRWEARGWHARAAIFEDGARPANLAVFAFGLSIGLAAITMSPPVREFVLNALAFLYILAIAWFLYNAVNLVDVAIRRAFGRRHTHSQLDDQLGPIIRKSLRLFLIIVFALFTAENIFKADIAAWLAGLGIAGLAVSLAAQDSLKNLFGSVTVFMDRPFMVGDLISFDGHTGSVETIGFRSTRIRTLNGEVVTIPNSKIVDSSLHNIGRRPHIRRAFTIGITYDTPPEKVEQAIQILKDILQSEEIGKAFDRVNFPPRVSFSDFGDNALNIQVFYWFTPADYWMFLEHAQVFNLLLLRRFNEAGIEFAFPTRTLYLADDPKRRLSVSWGPDGGAERFPA